jgi:GNAT superfamily N-acetyltransferase
MSDVVIRVRRSVHMDQCVAALRSVHDLDHYPSNWPANPRDWLTPPRLLRAWIAEYPRGILAGHVALQRVEAETNCRSGADWAELSRLFVTPAARRRSVATALLHHAVQWATKRGYQLTLSVTDRHRSAAVALYEANGWQYTHTTKAGWTAPDGTPVHLRHFVLTGWCTAQ